jgi:hypothetical protein
MKKRPRKRPKRSEPPYPGYQEHRKRGFWFGGYHYGEKGFFAGLLSIIFGYFSPLVGYLLGGIGMIYGYYALDRDQDFALSSLIVGFVGLCLATLWVVLFLRI